jgi:hypothetical protein
MLFHVLKICLFLGYFGGMNFLAASFIPPYRDREVDKNYSQAGACSYTKVCDIACLS